jgi:hypothetical protein
MKFKGRPIIIDRIRWVSTLAILAFGLSLAFSLGARAETQPQYSHDINTKNKGTPDPLRDDRYEKCGQDCLYKKGNENISFEAAYIMEKLDRLEALSKAGEHSQVNANLVGFCLSSETDGSGCFDRYKRAQVLKLHRMRAAIIQNQEKAANLNSRLNRKRMTQDGAAPPVFTQVFEKGGAKQVEGKLAQVPFVPKVKDLREIYGNNENLHRLVGDDYQKWVSEITPKPSPDEFVKFKTIPKDPNDPSSTNVTIVETNPDGSPVIDKKAYARALAIWNDREKDFEKKYMETFRISKPTKDAHQLQLAPESEEAYQEARNMMISAANRTETKSKGAAGKTAKAGNPGAAATSQMAQSLSRVGALSAPTQSKLGQDKSKDKPEQSDAKRDTDGNSTASGAVAGAGAGQDVNDKNGRKPAQDANAKQPKAKIVEKELDRRFASPGKAGETTTGSIVSFEPSVLTNELNGRYDMNPTLPGIE